MRQTPTAVRRSGVMEFPSREVVPRFALLGKGILGSETFDRILVVNGVWSKTYGQEPPPALERDGICLLMHL